MKNLLAFAFLLAGAAVTASALSPPVVPEIDPASGGSALALLMGSLILIRRRKR